MTWHKVDKGDTLWHLSRRFGPSVEAIARANNLKGKQIHFIQPGQILHIPDGIDDLPDTQLAIKFRALDFSPITPKRVVVACDGTETEYSLGADEPLSIAAFDHTGGIQVFIETPEREMESVFRAKTLPIGKWDLFLDSRMIKGSGTLQPKKGPELMDSAALQKTATHNAQLESGQTQHQKTRVEQGAPTHGVATIYVEKNLRLLPGNEKYRRHIIDAATKYDLTPQSLAALIDAEAAKVKGVWIEKSNQSDPALAQGLAQFFEDAWEDVFKDERSLLHTDCQRTTKSMRLKKRLEARYAIDSAASYALLNLESFEKIAKLSVTKLPPEEKAKFAYFLHHEGVGGALRVFGKNEPLTREKMTDRLAGQLGRKNIEQLNNLLARHKFNPYKAYYAWLYSYIDTNININSFTVTDALKFSEPPRGIADIIAGLEPAVEIPKTQPKQKQNPKTQSQAVAPQSNSTNSVNRSSNWHDPLDVCTLRTKGLSGKRGAMFGWTRNGGRRAHQGIDLAANPGTPIYAVADGLVYTSRQRSPNDAYGNTLVLVVNVKDLPPAQANEFRRINPHSDTIGFFYAHLSQLPESSQKIVNCGDIIGKTGSSGNAKGMDNIELGAHLHFEARLKARAITTGLNNRADPLPFIRNCTNK